MDSLENSSCCPMRNQNTSTAMMMMDTNEEGTGSSLTNLEKAFILSADYLSPKDVYKTFPLISKGFNEFVKTHFPRIILANFQHIPNSTPVPPSYSSGCVPKKNISSIKSRSNTDDEKCTKVKLSPAKISDEWEELPLHLQKFIGAKISGLKMFCRIDASILPQDCSQVQQMMACLRGAVHMMLTKSTAVPPPQSTSSNNGKNQETDVFVVPWEYTVHSSTFTSECILYKIQKMLQMFEIKRLELQEPNEMSLRLIKRDLISLTLEGLNSPLVLDRLSNLSQLRVLNLIGLGPEADFSDDKLLNAKSLLPLVKLAPTLETLFICRWFPLSDYSTFMNILGQLINLKSLNIIGLFQGDQAPHELALLVSRLNKLEYLDQLGHIDKDFWYHLCRFTEKKGLTNLKELALEYDIHTPQKCMENQLMGLSRLMPSLERVTLRFTEMPDSPPPSDDESSSMSVEPSPTNNDTTTPNSNISNTSYSNNNHNNNGISLHHHQSRRTSPFANSPGGQKLTSSLLLSIIHVWWEMYGHPRLKEIELVGFELSMDAIEKLASFNFNHVRPKVSIKRDVYDDSYFLH